MHFEAVDHSSISSIDVRRGFTVVGSAPRHSTYLQSSVVDDCVAPIVKEEILVQIVVILLTL